MRGHFHNRDLSYGYCLVYWTHGPFRREKRRSRRARYAYASLALRLPHRSHSAIPAMTLSGPSRAGRVRGAAVGETAASAKHIYI
jgi:hypothetical protein